jgi:hypothetical protein
MMKDNMMIDHDDHGDKQSGGEEIKMKMKIQSIPGLGRG